MNVNTSHQNRVGCEESETTTTADTTDTNEQLRPVSFFDISFLCFKAIGLLVITFLCFVVVIHHNEVFTNNDKDFVGITLSPRTQYRRNLFYTNVQQSRLLMNAGIMGFCAISFSSSFMQLMCFWIAKVWLKESGCGRGKGRLPTPLQMAVMFQIAEGGWGGIWGYISYAKEGKYIGQVTRAVRKMNNKRTVTCQPIPGWAIHLPAWLLGLVMITGTGISICGILLHTQSKPIDFISRRAVAESARSKFGRKLADGCKLAGDPRCTNFGETYKTLKGTSTLNKAASYGEFVYLAQANVTSNIDYEASSFALKVDCTIIDGCDKQWSPDTFTTKHRCAGYPLFDYMNFEGNFEFLIDNHENGTSSGSNTMKENPYHIGIRGRLDPRLSPPGSSSASAPREDLLLWCKVTAYNVTYTIFKETIMEFKPEHSNGEIGRIFCEPFHGGLANLLLEEDFRAAQTWSGTNEEVCHAWANLYSTIAISQVVGVMDFDSNQREWNRTVLQGTEIPRNILMAIYILVTTLFFIALLLAAVAWFATRNGGRVRELAMKITPEGLVAQMLNQHGTETNCQIEHIRDYFNEREKQKGKVQRVKVKEVEVGRRIIVQFVAVDEQVAVDALNRHS